MKNQNFLSTTQLAEILGLSRIAVYKKIKAGEIKAIKIGRNYVINKADLGGILNDEASQKEIALAKKAVKKAVKEYGETFKLLGSA